MADTILGSKLMFSDLDVDEDKATVLIGSGRVYMINATNFDATLVYLKFFDALIAGVTLGTTVLDFTFTIPVLTAAVGHPFSLVIPGGLQFDTGITIAATTGLAVADTTGPGTNECVVNIAYG